MAEKIVEFENVSFGYGRQPAVEKATFSIERGDFVGVIGPNGSGKTTIVKLMLNLLKPDEGSIMIFGKGIADFREWRRVGYVPQKATNFDQNFPATVFEVASMGRIPKAGLARRLSSADYAAVERALKTAGILNLRDSRIGDLSGGQQQRVFIARALATEPELLILDEPTVGVDMEAQHNFYALLRRLNKEFGLTLVLVSHDIGLVSKNVNKLACVNIAVTFHDVSKGLSTADLHCAYPAGMAFVPHHHHIPTPSARFIR
ncbi:MAG: metal ABC transporter ATP-binding protein [Candidatus Micrarchaeota archaeon]|nr:metal ABC transporter ATP-binding protein [Candidatus Micrarchaeota archaeon]